MHEIEELISLMRFSKVKRTDVYNLLNRILITNAEDRQHFIDIINRDRLLNQRGSTQHVHFPLCLTGFDLK